MQIEKRAENEVLVYLENGRHCTFRTVEAAERMREIVQEISEEKNNFLKLIEIENDRFDVAFKEDYLVEFAKWVSEHEDFSIESIDYNDYFCANLTFKNRAVRLLPYSHAIHVRNAGESEWTKDNIEILSKLPKTKLEFEKIIRKIA